MDAQVVSKGEFAKICNVSAGRVSQWIAEGKIGPAELVGEGRSAKIHVERARQKLALKIDPGQRLGNGADTRLAGGTVTAPAGIAQATPAAAPAVVDDLDLKLKQARLEQAEAANRKAREDELVRKGVYVRAEHANAEAGRLATTIVQMMDGVVSDIASEIAAQFHLPARDVTHLARKILRAGRAKMAEKLANDALALPDTIEDGD